MTKETFKSIKKDYIKSLKEYIIEEGGIFAHFTFFGEKLDEPDLPPSMINVPLSDEFMATNEGKDKFMKNVFPKLSATLKSKFNILGVAWASEAWMSSKDDSNKEEILIINIESEFENDLQIYVIKRKGLQVTQDGEISDKIQLIKKQNADNIRDTMKGRFVGLYEKLKKEDFND